jgi:pyrroloquinoline quinone biosynthesis protein E
LGVIHFSLLGGEPLLRDDLEEIVQHASRKGRAVTVTTNGLLLTERRLENLARSGLFSLVISLDRLSGPAKGDPELAFGLLERAKSMGITPMIHSVIMSGNEEEVPVLACEATRRGFFFSCSLYQSVGGIQSRPRDSLVPNETKVVEAFSQIRRIKRSTGLVRTTYSYVQNLPKYFDKGWHCDPAKSTWIAAKSDGTLLACAEWQLEASILDIDELDAGEFYRLRKRVTDQCRGCYYECYFSEQQVFRHLWGLLTEIPVSPTFWRHSLELLRKRAAHSRRLDVADEQSQDD